MTLAEWAAGWPYAVTPFRPTNAATGRPGEPIPGVWVTPDAGPRECDPAYRARGFRLSDVSVTSVSGGSLWFDQRHGDALTAMLDRGTAD